MVFYSGVTTTIYSTPIPLFTLMTLMLLLQNLVVALFQRVLPVLRVIINKIVFAEFSEFQKIFIYEIQVFK